MTAVLLLSSRLPLTSLSVFLTFTSSTATYLPTMAQTLTTAFRTWVATRIGPLTTHFTPPASCLTINYTPGPNIADVPVLNAQTSVGAAITETAIADGATAETTTANAYLGETTRSECYPSNLLPYAQVGLIINPTIGYYSPAICPSSYTPACPDNRDLVDSNESASMCCPMYPPFLPTSSNHS